MRRAPVDALKFPLSQQDSELIGQALDVYAATLMCAPLGLGLELMVSVRALRDRLEQMSAVHETAAEAADDPDSNVIVFARA